MSMLLLSSDTPEECIRSHYRWLCATMWLLGIELGTFRKSVSALIHWAISLTLELIFYLAALLKQFWSLSVYQFWSSLVEFWGTVMYTNISSTNSDITMTSSFPICTCFISFCCLIALARTSAGRFFFLVGVLEVVEGKEHQWKVRLYLMRYRGKLCLTRHLGLLYNNKKLACLIYFAAIADLPSVLLWGQKLWSLALNTSSWKDWIQFCRRVPE